MTNHKTRISLLRALTFASTPLYLLAPTPVNAAELSTDPGDMVALPAGTELGVLYYQHAQRDKIKAKGHTLPVRFGLNSDIAVVRYVHWMDVGGVTITPQVIVPFGQLDKSGVTKEKSSGMGDPLAGSMVWVINDHAKERYFNVGGFIEFPIGSHDEKKGNINVGGNRWKAILQSGYSCMAKLQLNTIGMIKTLTSWNLHVDKTVFLKQQPICATP